MSTVIYESIGRNIRRILINRPAKRNAIDIVTITTLKDAIRQFEEDETGYVAILAGAGGNFCSGYDLNEIVDRQSSMPNIHRIEQMLWPIGNRLSEKPIIAAIEGHAVGFGYELALRCHFRVAEKDSRLGFLNRRFGIPIMNGGTVILPHLVGSSHATELIATGKAQLAGEAHQIGILNYICDIGCSQGRALSLARCLAKFDQSALLHDLKSTMELSQDMESVEQRLILERNRSLAYLKSCGPLDIAVKFLDGQLCRHGNTDLGNLISPETEVTL